MTTLSELPPTTLKLLRAVKLASLRSKDKITKVVIRGEGENTGIFYFPKKNALTSEFVEREGIADAVAYFVFDKTRYRVAGKFRSGSYDVSGDGIKIIR